MDVSSNAPSPSNLEPNDEQFLARLIRKKVRQIVCQTGFRPDDDRDIEQQLRLKVAKHLSAYQGDQGHLYPFLTAVVDRHAATIVRDQTSPKRDPSRVVSLSIQVEVEGEGPAELGATITQREADSRLGRRSRDHEYAFNLKHDLDATIRKLTPDERKVCEGLKFGSITEVARELEIPRTTIYDMIARLQQVFQDENLREYL